MEKNELKKELESGLFEHIFGPEREDYWMDLAREFNKTGRRKRVDGESQEDWDKYLYIVEYLESIIKYDNLIYKIKV